MLARKRYQSADQMRKNIEELIQRIDGTEISHSVFCECSRQILKLDDQWAVYIGESKEEAKE